MAFFRDELARETCTFLSATTLKLNGAYSEFYVRFRSCKRRDGTAVQSGDTCIVGVAQTGVGRAVCRAALTLGADDTLTLDNSLIKQSTAGSGLPGFSSSGAVGEVYIASTADDAAFDDAGNLLRPDLFRLSQFKRTIEGAGGFIGELGTVDNEAVLALGKASASDPDYLGGPVWYDAQSSETPDGLDVWQNLNTSTGRILRLPIKLARTKRGDALASGNLLTLHNFSTAGLRWLVDVFDATAAHRATALVLGHASDPQVDVLCEMGALPFELSGTSLGVRNNSGGALTVAHAKAVI